MKKKLLSFDLFLESQNALEEMAKGNEGQMAQAEQEELAALGAKAKARCEAIKKEIAGKDLNAFAKEHNLPTREWDEDSMAVFMTLKEFEMREALDAVQKFVDENEK